ncbi:MAG: metallophosphoesterase [Methanobacteriaceae archaeon]
MIGIMADSHDHLEAIRKAVDLFNQVGVELVIHAGDLIAPFTAQEFMNLQPPFEAVFGNNDGEKQGLRMAYENLCILEDFKELKISGRNIVVIHGKEQRLVDALAQSGNYDLVVRGHTHQKEIIDNKTLIINPGETCGYVSGERTIILLDPVDMSWEVVYL